MAFDLVLMIKQVESLIYFEIINFAADVEVKNLNIALISRVALVLNHAVFSFNLINER